MKKTVPENFSLTRQERRGVAILCSLIVLAWAVPLIIRQFRKSGPQDFKDFEHEVDAFTARLDATRAAPDSSKEEAPRVYNADELPEPFPFDPNTLPEKGWEKLGLPLKVIHTIQHYRKAGGHFFQKEDLKKIYGLSEETYAHLEPYIKIKPQKKPATEKDYASTKNKLSPPVRRASAEMTIDINQADSSDWVKLRGIGPVLSSRIIKFRKALGGFYNIDQIAEVYGLPDSIFERIRHQLNITTKSLKKLNINTATIDELKSHPYIGYRLAAAIKAFREQHGSFKSLEELKQVQLVDDEIYRKLVPYLTVK